MDLDSLECISTVDTAEEEEISHQPHHHGNYHGNHQFPGKPHSNVVVPNAIAPATSVHELLECPVCTNSMYPPIHQARLWPLKIPGEFDKCLKQTQ